MSFESQNPMDCTQFEALLTEAVEGTLPAAEMEAFRLHAGQCRLCGALFAEAQAGHRWLEQLAEVEPPARLLHNILAATSAKDEAEAARKRVVRPGGGWREQIRLVLGPLMQPRLAGTFAMAFFSISVLLNLAGVRLGDLKAADFKPGNIRATITRDYYTGRAQVIRYYENMRLVYELQSRLRDLRNALPQQQEQAPEEKKNKKEKENRNMSNQPSQDQQNYVQADTGNYEIASYTIPIKDYRAQFSPSGSRHLQSVGARQRRMA